MIHDMFIYHIKETFQKASLILEISNTHMFITNERPLILFVRIVTVFCLLTTLNSLFHELFQTWNIQDTLNLLIVEQQQLNKAAQCRHRPVESDTLKEREKTKINKTLKYGATRNHDLKTTYSLHVMHNRILKIGLKNTANYEKSNKTFSNVLKYF